MGIVCGFRSDWCNIDDRIQNPQICRGFCPLFDFLAPLDMAVVCTLVQIYGLGSKCHLKCTVMIASEDKFRTTVWLNFAVRLERFPAQLSQPFLQTDFKRFLLVSQRMNFPIGLIFLKIYLLL